MNSTWLVFLTLLMVVLIAVAMGAQQIQAQQAQEISWLTDQRDTAVKVALESQKQRDEAVAKVDGLNSEIASLRDDLRNTQNVAGNRQAEIDRLVKEANDLQAQVQVLQAQKQDLEAKFAALQQGPMPVTGNQDTEADQCASPARVNSICLPVRPGNLAGQMALGLAVLVGMAALGSGGYIVFHHDTSRKYAVRMTREQIKEYARYQHEHSSRAS